MSQQLNFLRSVGLAIVAVLSIGQVHAGSIEGALNFGGEVVAIPGPGLSDAIGLSFTSGFVVTNSTGTFDAVDVGIGFGDIGTMSDFFFNPLTPNPVTAFLQILFSDGPGKFTYSLASIEIIDQSDGFLVLAGCGTLSGTDLDDTEYAISLSIDGVGSLYAFSGTLAPKVVPIPGALLLMLSALGALGIRRR